MTCTACKRDQQVVARGLCRACYQRWWKRGTTDYAERGRSICSIGGCDDVVSSNGLCEKHRQRLRKHGHTEQTRPDSWGSKSNHPLTHTWKWMMRHAARSSVCEEWKNDFLQFVNDVGERPGPSYKLFRIRDDEPIGPNNFTWRRSITEKRPGESKEETERRRQRIYRVARKEAHTEYDLKKNYGLSRNDYITMHEEQSGKCAICGSEETLRIRGNVVSMAVDHCHDTGKVRGLLCSSCNTALGGFKDSPEILQRAIEYLRQHHGS